MRLPNRHAMAIAIAALYSSHPVQAGAAAGPDTSSAVANPEPQKVAQAATATSPTVAPAATAVELDTVRVTAKRLDAARNGLSPDTGSTIYRFDQDDIAALPFGSATPLNQVILQAPARCRTAMVSCTSAATTRTCNIGSTACRFPRPSPASGRRSTRASPTRSTSSPARWPAQYGYRTAGIVDIRTRGAGFENGGNISGLGGSFGHAEGSAEYSGTSGAWTYYGTGSFLRDRVGIENPTSSREPIHDTTRQQKAFAYLSNIIDANSRISLIFGSSNNKFEIPDVPGQTTTYAIDGDPAVDSAKLDARQHEKNTFGIVSYQASPTDKVDYQLSFFTRHTDVAYQPDPLGDLLFNGVGAQIVRKKRCTGPSG